MLKTYELIITNQTSKNITKISNNLNDFSNEKNTKLQETKHSEHKLQNNDYIIKLLKCGFSSRADNVLHCSSYLVFSLQQNIYTSDERIRLKRANFCKDRFCSTCNWRRSLNLARELQNALEAIKEQRKVEILFLTLTAKNEPIERLRETIREMNKSFQRLIQTKRFKRAVLGFIKAVEILGSKTPAGQSHVHFHCLLVVPKSYFTSRDYIKHADWVAMWKKALRADYDPVVNVKKIKPRGNWSAERSASKETIKYSIKHTDLTSRSDEDFTHIINQTRGMRFVSTGGILKEMINLQRVEDELIQNDKEPLWYEIAELIYEWLNGDFYLKQTNRVNATM